MKTNPWAHGAFRNSSPVNPCQRKSLLKLFCRIAGLPVRRNPSGFQMTADRYLSLTKVVMAPLQADARKEPISLAEKVSFLRQTSAYPSSPERIEVRETHMSWVFLGDRFVYKLKKPVRYDFLDFSTIEARHRDCEREVRLNRRLAGDVYLGTVALRLQNDGSLTLEGEGRITDWLVKMRRLPSQSMLDEAIENDTVQPRDVARFSDVLADFYQNIALPVAVEPGSYRHRFEDDIAANMRELGKPEFALSTTRLDQLTRAQQAFLARHGHQLEQRAADGRIVEAHGDLRPQHICLLSEPVIIDCLEFNRELRILDPVDELAYLALECERLGAPWIGTEVLRRYAQVTDDRPSAELIAFYKTFRACLRAKIAMWHTEDHDVRDHDHWRERARYYLELALRYAECW